MPFVGHPLQWTHSNTLLAALWYLTNYLTTGFHLWQARHPEVLQPEASLLTLVLLPPAHSLVESSPSTCILEVT
jgi:hypothetical protein